MALASVLVATGARAEPPEAGRARIELSIEPCTDVSPDEVRRIAAIELRATAVEAPVHDPGTTRAEVSCEGEVAKIRVLDPLTGKSLARDIALDRVAAPARSRLLALAVVELVSASWIELEANPAPEVAPVAPPVRGEDRVAALEVVRERAASQPVVASAPRAAPGTWRITAELGVRWFAVDSEPLLGVGARVGVDPLSTLGVDLDVMAEHGTSSSALGSVALDSASIGAVMRFRREIARLTLHGGPGVRAGLAWIAGYPSAPALAVGHQIDGVWAAPVAAVGIGYTTPQHLALELGLEAGYVVLPVRGIVDEGRDVRADGFFSGATIGAGWAF